MNLFHTCVRSPVGELKLVASDAGIRAILWAIENPKRVSLPASAAMSDHPVLRWAKAELEEYFAGARSSFSVPLDLRGTEFQRWVWSALLKIPYGDTRTYGQLAAEAGNPLLARAVGAANGRNPVSIVVPCHRVIGVSGNLTGFAGGLDAKAYLLRLESRIGPLFHSLTEPQGRGDLQ